MTSNSDQYGMPFKAILTAAAVALCAAGPSSAEDKSGAEAGPLLNLLVPDVLREDRAKRPDLAITIAGYQYGWRYDYTDRKQGEAVRCRADALVLPQGKVVDLTLSADDVIHEWSVPALGLASDSIPGLLNVVRVDTARAGTFTGGATSISGEGYEKMAFELHILPPDAYEVWQNTALIHCEVP